MHPLAQFKFCPKCGSNLFVENNFKSKKCESCGFIYYFNPCSSTIALIFNDKNELLVATRAHEPAKGTFDLPGGFVDMDETGEQAVRREVKEETGLEVTSLEYLFSLPNKYIYSGFEVQTLDMVYRCAVENDQYLDAEDDVAKLEFIRVEELNPDLFGLHSVKEIIKKIKDYTPKS